MERLVIGHRTKRVMGWAAFLVFVAASLALSWSFHQAANAAPVTAIWQQPTVTVDDREVAALAQSWQAPFEVRFVESGADITVRRGVALEPMTGGLATRGEDGDRIEGCTIDLRADASEFVMAHEVGHCLGYAGHSHAGKGASSYDCPATDRLRLSTDPPRRLDTGRGWGQARVRVELTQASRRRGGIGRAAHHMTKEPRPLPNDRGTSGVQSCEVTSGVVGGFLDASEPRRDAVQDARHGDKADDDRLRVLLDHGVDAHVALSDADRISPMTTHATNRATRHARADP